jgi:hypothetical protein
MDRQQQGFNWAQILISIVFAVVGSTILGTLVTLAYGLFVGFQTRGDSDRIAQQIGLFTQSFVYIIISALITGAVVYWRARALSRKIASSYIAHVLIVGVVTVALGALIALLVSGLPAGVIGAQVASQLVLVALVAFLSNRQFQAQATPA